jgi:predicted DCC family thiol-disulfide oxidoreductase YuxK
MLDQLLDRRILGGWWRIFLVAAVIPKCMRDWFYALIARNRYRWLGKADYCALLTQEQRRRLL